MLRKQRERGVFMQNTRTQIHFRDSLFIGKISISSCCSAGKETKKTARERQHFREQRMVVGGAEEIRTLDLYDANVSL